MIFEITVYEGTSKAKIENIGTQPYHYNLGGVKIDLPVGGSAEYPVQFIKHMFGDWEQKGVYAEIQRQKAKGIQDFTLQVKSSKMTPLRDDFDKSTANVKQVTVESEFESLEEELHQCVGQNKNGLRCKRMVEGQYCPQHEPKE